jgi:hypothetical protein
MPPAKQSCLHNFGLWTLCCIGMCVPWDIEHRDGTFSSLPCIHFTRAIGAPFLISSGGSCISFGRECTNELWTTPEARDYLSHSSSPICFGRRAKKALWQMGPSLIIHTSDGSSGIRAINTCHEGIRPRAIDEPEPMDIEEAVA